MNCPNSPDGHHEWALGFSVQDEVHASCIYCPAIKTKAECHAMLNAAERLRAGEASRKCADELERRIQVELCQNSRAR